MTTMIVPHRICMCRVVELHNPAIIIIYKKNNPAIIRSKSWCVQTCLRSPFWHRIRLYCIGLATTHIIMNLNPFSLLFQNMYCIHIFILTSPIAKSPLFHESYYIMVRVIGLHIDNPNHSKEFYKNVRNGICINYYSILLYLHWCIEDRHDFILWESCITHCSNKRRLSFHFLCSAYRQYIVIAFL